jgi:phosphoribosylformimino-5-aminoimidazole carboxamide ribotide isomerase
MEALQAYPGGLHVGGGINLDNAAAYLDNGASHVIVTSFVFREGRLDWERLNALVCPPSLRAVCC